ARRYMDVEETLRRQGPEYGVPLELIKLLGKMVAFEPKERFQTPQQLVEAIRDCREDLRGHDPTVASAARGPTGPRTLFVVEPNDKLKEAFRDKFKRQGYRVLLSNDPGLALTR